LEWRGVAVRVTFMARSVAVIDTRQSEIEDYYVKAIFKKYPNII
jgi:hypothetical protein